MAYHYNRRHFWEAGEIIESTDSVSIVVGYADSEEEAAKQIAAWDQIADEEAAKEAAKEEEEAEAAYKVRVGEEAAEEAYDLAVAAAREAYDLAVAQARQ